jgi:hypothetical protein
LAAPVKADVMPLRDVIVLSAIALSQLASGNELFDVSPTGIRLTGQDAFGERAYELSATIERNGPVIRLTALRIKVGAKETVVDPGVLGRVDNPNFGSVSVADDTGVQGSHLHFSIPFGDAVKCAAGRRGDKYRKLVIEINSDGSVERVHIYDPCAKA